MASPPDRSRLVPLMLILSMTTGLVDAISVLGLGKVFTANMTGNIVFLGFAVAGTPGFQVAPYVAALLFFLVGALIAGRVARYHEARSLPRWLTIAATLEAVLLGIAAVVAISYDMAALRPASHLYAIIGLTAVAMGFRNATIRQLKIPDLTTTVLTLTLTGLAADSAAAGGDNPNWRRRLASVAAIFTGALVGALLVARFGLSVPLALAGAFVLVGTFVGVRRL